jgi:hypothetical protein
VTRHNVIAGRLVVEEVGPATALAAFESD